MTPIPVLTIPFYNRKDLLERCIQSIDYPIKRLVIVTNGSIFIHSWWVSAFLPKVAKTQETVVCVIRHDNAGVAASWNEVIKLYPAKYWMLVNNDIQFSPGDLEKMHLEIERDCLIEPTVGCYYGNHGASFWAVTASGIAEVGTFDENFYPAYCEDCDWSVRADILGVKRVNIEGINSIHGVEGQRGSCTVNANGDIANKNMRTHGENLRYYKEKWGGFNGKEKYKFPFNNPAWPVWAWRFDPVMRKRNQW